MSLAIISKMLFWVIVSFVLFLVLLISEFGLFPYRSSLTENIIQITNYGLFHKTLNVSSIIKLELMMINLEDPIITIRALTSDKTYNLIIVGVFNYESNIKFVKQLLQVNPLINVSQPNLQKYLYPKPGTVVINEHLAGYVLLIASFLFFVITVFKFF